MRRKRGLEARARLGGAPVEPMGTPVTHRAPAWVGTGTAMEAAHGPAVGTISGTPRRFVAWLVAYVGLGLATVVLIQLADPLLGIAPPVPGEASVPAAVLTHTAMSALLSLAYFLVLWTGGRSTIGMWTFGIRVADAATGAPITARSAVRRWLLLEGVVLAIGVLSDIATWVSSRPEVALAGLLGTGWAIVLLWTTMIDPRKQGLHDRFADTLVIRRG